MYLTEQIFSDIFSDAATFCGHESVIHNIIYHHLLRSGYHPTQVAREQRLAKAPCDVVIFDPAIEGQFHKTNSVPIVAIEVKGGAYNTRNALRDEISSNGHCTDIDKLSAHRAHGIEGWFVCVDMAELGRAVEPSRVNDIHRQCQKAGIGFAYMCQADPCFYMSYPGTALCTIPINQSPHRSTTPIDVTDWFSTENPSFMSFCNLSRHISGAEANICSHLYHTLRLDGLSSSQLSTETYFKLSSTQKGMQCRPDFTIFDDQFDGRFNLYRGGNQSQSNDPHKLRHLTSMIEVKGGGAFDSYSSKVRLPQCYKDIDKLHDWRLRCDLQNGKLWTGVFIVVDKHKRSLSDAEISALIDHAGEHVVVYISPNEVISSPRIPHDSAAILL